MWKILIVREKLYSINLEAVDSICMTETAASTHNWKQLLEIANIQSANSNRNNLHINVC